VTPTDQLLLSPQILKEPLTALPAKALRAGHADSPVASVFVEDPRR
jgi:hypothetical protein